MVSRLLTCTLVFLFLVCPVQADDRDDILDKYRGFSTREVKSVRIASGWATAHWAAGDGGGMDLYHKVDGRWYYIIGGGGAIGPRDLFAFGVPRAVIGQLTIYTPSEQEISEAVSSYNKPEWTWLTSKRRLTDEELEYKGAWELLLMRNEIFAKYGRRFQDAELNAYFQSRPWYRVNAQYHDGMLTPLERSNAAFISAYQKKNKLEI